MQHNTLVFSLHRSFAFIIGLCLSGSALAHLPAYEGERVRNDNHFTDNGFAEPVRGACDIGGFGPTDPDAGSANIYLGAGNVPPNFFCAFTSQDDWSFEFPVDIIETGRVPSPDPRDLLPPETPDVVKTAALEEGYIPCNPDLFPPELYTQCPRTITNPQDGTTFDLPGLCVDTGQSLPGGSEDPDGIYHCALLPGAPRPRESSVFFSTLTGLKDVDWGIYRYDPVYEETPIVGAPQVPACEENLGTFVTFAYAGPLDLLDARSNQPIFQPLYEAGPLPAEITENLPEGYGIRVTRPDSFRPSAETPRLGYASGFAQNGWLLAPDSVVQCIDDFENCLADQTGELNKHYRGNDIFFVDENEPVDLYLMWWMDQRAQVRGFNRNGYRERLRKWLLTDVSMTTGVVDQFIVGDYIAIGNSGPFGANGRYVHGKCTDPRVNGATDMTIETNQ